MKVLLINGSPNKEGCTYTALAQIASTLNKEGIETEIFHIGNKPIAGFVFGTPVFFASANGAMSAFMDRLFIAEMCSGRNAFYMKPAACVVSARRAGRDKFYMMGLAG